MKVAIANRQRRHPIGTPRLRKVAERILSALGYPDSELSVVITGDLGIRRVNREYLHKDRPTNVISFAMAEGEFGALNPAMLGDVIISADTAAREAEEGGVSFWSRLCFLLLHGILHIAGYDHERSGEAEARRMEAKEQELFALLEREGLV
ncbi:rRNA maturation RNase YbeY [Geobacter hydrogenophilus]|uniref:rRNA maturation RNase YbeY n=1 Tax=Geobacter hydrogenophilus TaxID=40983 RepID=UPI001BD95262|nr:rRNA maturation RNase YbeY [Geobacter hydrogenophilus]MBT0892324.1 rRNA maturation RNase YbeY [Geobacter hydrogenophilus]